MFVAPRPVVFLAVHDPGLLRMKLQAAFCEATPDGFQHRSSFLLAPAVDDGVVRITLEAAVLLMAQELDREYPELRHWAAPATEAELALHAAQLTRLMAEETH
jgi:hypothetical protein